MTDTTNVIMTSTAKLSFKDGILYVEILEYADLDEKTLTEQFETRNKLIGDREFTVLVDARKNHNATREGREFMAKSDNPNRKALAIMTNNLAVKLIANFYIKINKPKTPTKLFNDIKEAEKWLKTFL